MSLISDIKNTVKEKNIFTLVRYFFEFILFAVVFVIFKILPLDSASALGGLVGRSLAPHMGMSRRADSNLSRALPHLTAQERKAIIKKMWDHLGRIVAEYPHIGALAKRFTYKGGAHMAALAHDHKPGLIISGHIGHWEASPFVASHFGVHMAIIYRRPNNPFIAAALDTMRSATGMLLFPKGPAGGLKIFRYLKAGGHVALLVDQKLNEGLPLTFFGMRAMTAPAAAEWALRLKAPMVLARTRRLKGAYFEAEIEPVDHIPDTHTPEHVTALMQRINDRIEVWIREEPSQWLWIHNRWNEE